MPEEQERWRKWQPGPNVATELKRLEDADRQDFAAFSAGHLDKDTLHREQARRKVTGDFLKAWSFAHQRDELPNLAVILYGSNEHRQVFPLGLGHLPKQMQSREVYPATPEGRRRWRYMGQRKEGKFNFVLFIEAKE